MNGSGRKRISKWDLKEVPQFPLENELDNACSGNLTASYNDKESQPGRHSPGVAGSNGPKWSFTEANDVPKSKHNSALPLREPISGSRGSQKNDSIDKDCSEFSEATMAWDGDGNYSMRMSPGLDEWRQRNRSHTPKSGWSRSFRSSSRSRSRSRSRSLPRGFKRDLGVNDRTRIRSGVPTQSCKDFAAGRCRRGNRCEFLHQDNHYEDRRYPEDGLTDSSWESRHRKGGASKYSIPHDTREHPVRGGRSTECCNDFLKGRCRRGASCKYAHDVASDGYGKGPANEVIRGRENDRRNTGASFERSSEREPRRNSDIPCKFFPAGNCRNGKYCRFSHLVQACVSPGGRSRRDRCGLDHNLDNADQLREGPKWSDATLSDDEELCEDKNKKMGNPELRVTTWSMDDRWDHNLDNSNKTQGDPTSGDKAVDSVVKESLQGKTENTGATMGVYESRGTDKWLGDMDMSPEWNYRVRTPNHIVKEEPGHVTQSSQSLNLNETSLPTSEQDVTREAAGQIHHAAAVMQPTIFEKSYFQQNPNSREDAAIAFPYNDKNAIGNSATSHIDLNFSDNILPGKSFDQNGQSIIAQPLSGLNAVGQSQLAFAPEPPSGESIRNPQNQVPFQDSRSSNKPDTGDANASLVTSGMLPSSEQLAQLTNLSASLAQLFGNGQQLPQLYAALNPPKAMEFVPSLPNSAGPVALLAAASIQPNPAIGPQKQYDPICDSIEQMKPDTCYHPPGFLPNAVGQKSIADEKPEIPLKNLSQSAVTGWPNGGNFNETGSSVEDRNHENHQSKQPEPVANSEVEENNGMGAEESKKALEETKKARENSPLENMDGDGGVDEGKKSKDVRGIRAFKFSLVEFVKELLKPAWKEGQISKEAYKTIVKKVADKVTGAIQEAHIPQTQEKIDQYLSFSKPKLTKLVQAYVEKHQKELNKT